MTTKFNARNPVNGETGKKLLMQWSINILKENSSIKTLSAYVQPQSKKETVIVYWVNERMQLTDEAEALYGDRLKANFENATLTVDISDAIYNDSGNYRMEVSLNSGSNEGRSDVVTVNVHGMIFSYFV